MPIRVVRFTGVNRERIDAVKAIIEESGGPPPGVPSTGLDLLYDEAGQTAVVLQHFATAEDLQTGARVMEAMDVGETPGTRASVDACEVLLEIEA